MFGRNKPPTIDQDGHPAAPVVAQPVVRAPAHAALTQEQMAAIAQLNNSDRLKALISALKRAQKAATAGPYFDPDSGIRALEKGSMRLTGTRDQIEAQLLVQRVAVVVMKRLFKPPTDKYADPLGSEPDEPL